MALSKTTRDHDEIRRWAEERGAKPAAVASTETDDQTGIIRLEFPGAPNAKDSALEEISWDEWFEKFDSSGLDFTYQDRTAAGERSNFNKLTYPGNAKTKSSRGRSSSSRSTARPSSKSHSRSATRKSTAKSGSSKKSTGASGRSTGSSSARSTGRTADASSRRGSSNRTTGRASSTGRKSATKTAAKKSSRR